MESSLEKKQRVNLLMDCYIDLLTDKQREYLSLYYEEDLSLSEIAEDLDVSRNAVYDNLKRAVTSLEDYEKKLHLLEKHIQRMDLIQRIETEQATSNDQLNDYLEMLKNIQEGVFMAFESLSERLQESLKKIRGQATLTEDNMDEMLREIRLALLEADVNFQVVKEFIAKTKEKALGQDVLGSLKPGQVVVKIVHDELVELLGTSVSELDLSKSPAVVMMVGLQ